MEEGVGEVWVCVEAGDLNASNYVRDTDGELERGGDSREWLGIGDSPRAGGTEEEVLMLCGAPWLALVSSYK